MKQFVLAAVMLTACAQVRESEGSANRDQIWTLQMLDGERLTGRQGSVVTLRLNPDRTIGGTAACNSTSSAKLRWTEEPGAMRGAFDRLGQGAGISTTALCGDREAVAIANRFWDSMETARTWSVDRGRLLIKFADRSEAHLVLLTH